MYFPQFYPLFASLLSLLSFTGFISRSNSLISRTATFLYLYLYLAGMLRYKGVDLWAYQQSYHSFNANHLVSSSDIFYIGLTSLFSSLGIPFIIFLFICSLLGLYTLRHLSSYFELPFYVISPLFLTSVIIVRDFSQLRIGLSIYFALLLVCRNKSLPKPIALLLLFASIFTHISSLFFLLSFTVSKLISSSNSLVKYLFFTLLVSLSLYLFINSISLFSFIDPRISLYINIQREGYGISRPEYLLTFIYSLITLFSLPPLLRSFNASQSSSSIQFRVLFVLNSISSFILFSSFTVPSIFVMRLYSLSATLTPILLVYLVRFYMNSFKPRLFSTCFGFAVLISYSMVSLFRSTSVSIINTIQSYIL